MRTTVTLDPDTEQLIRQRMTQRGVSFKQALNDALREECVPCRSPAPVTRAASLDVPSVNLDRALQLAGELEDDELLRRMQVGS